MSENRVLVVDDEPEFGEIVRNVADGLGYAVKVTTSGAAFKEAYGPFRPTVVVLDVIMPEIDGVELVQWLADRDSTVRLIVVTGYAPSYAELTRKLGEAKGLRSVTTLTKPVRIARLRAALAGE